MVEVRPALAQGNLRLVLELEILAIPLADGGEGTTEARVEEQLGWLAEARAVLEMGRLAKAAKRT